MEDCVKVNTLVECGAKMSKNDKREKAKLFSNQKPSQEFEIFDMHSFGYYFFSGFVSRFIETPTMIHFKALK